MQTIHITGNPSTSRISSFASNLHAANESIHTDKKIGMGNLGTPTTAINKIGCTEATLGTAANFGLKNIKLQTPVEASLTKPILPYNGCQPGVYALKVTSVEGEFETIRFVKY